MDVFCSLIAEIKLLMVKLQKHFHRDYLHTHQDSEDKVLFAVYLTWSKGKPEH